MTVLAKILKGITGPPLELACNMNQCSLGLLPLCVIMLLSFVLNSKAPQDGKIITDTMVHLTHFKKKD